MSKVGSAENLSMLHTEPSFCIYAEEDGLLENDKSDLEIITSKGMNDCDFTFAERSMELILEDDEDDKSSGLKNMGNEEQNIEPPSPKMYLATGFGIDVMGGYKFEPTTYNEEYYEMMISEDPCNPLLLRNYAQLLQSKGDLTGAEDYYLRATIQDPKDGEILMQYAKLVWELHRDQDRAQTYFEKAVLAAPEDCNILAAYASFLWEIEQVQDKQRL